MEWLEVSTENCTVRRTLDVVGEKWSLLVLRDAMNGVRRFDDFRRHIGLSDAVLADRLRKLVGAGILDTVPYQESGRRTRNEYRLTSKGWDLWPVMLALKEWGDHYTADPAGPPLDVYHSDCGEPLRTVVTCADGHGPLRPREAGTRPGPAARPLAQVDRGGSGTDDSGRPTAATTAAATATATATATGRRSGKG